MSLQDTFQSRLGALTEDFDFLDDWEDRYRHIIDLGKSIAPLCESEKNDETKVRGCASQVWLVCEFDDANFLASFRGESDSTLVQGLLAILIKIYSNLQPKEIIDNPPQNVFETLRLEEALTPSRANGLKSMAARIVDFARAKLG